MRNNATQPVVLENDLLRKKFIRNTRLAFGGRVADSLKFGSSYDLFTYYLGASCVHLEIIMILNK